jgi:hypothetical protein
MSPSGATAIGPIGCDMVATVVGPPAASRRSSREPTVTKTVPDGERTTAYGWSSDAKSTVTAAGRGIDAEQPARIVLDEQHRARRLQLDRGGLREGDRRGGARPHSDRAQPRRSPTGAGGERPAAGGGEDERRPVHPVPTPGAHGDPARAARRDPNRAAVRRGPHREPERPGAAGDGRRALARDRDAHRRRGGRGAGAERRQHEHERNDPHNRCDASDAMRFAKEFAIPPWGGRG